MLCVFLKFRSYRNYSEGFDCEVEETLEALAAQQLALESFRELRRQNDDQHTRNSYVQTHERVTTNTHFVHGKKLTDKSLLLS